MSSDPKLIPYVLPLIEGHTILDVGCGRGKWGYLLRVDFWYTSARNFGEHAKYLVGTDVFLPYLKFANEHRIYDDVVLCDALHLPIKDKAFETTIAVEVIEHLRKENGNRLLSEAERVSKKSVIVTTPHHPFQQNSIDENVHQEHLSKWSAKEFSTRGYTVFCKPIMSSFSSLAFSFLASRLVRVAPKLLNLLPLMPFCLIAKKTDGL